MLTNKNDLLTTNHRSNAFGILFLKLELHKDIIWIACVKVLSCISLSSTLINSSTTNSAICWESSSLVIVLKLKFPIAWKH